MNTKEAAELWGCTTGTVARYAKSGIIPGAEKRGAAWEIPADALRPRLTRTRACALMQDMISTAEGARPRHFYALEECGYMADCGFITDIAGLTDHRQILARARPTSAGLQLMAAERNSLKVSSSLSVDLGILKGSLNIEN